MARGRQVPPADAVVRLEFAIPGSDEPGFLRRQRTAAQHMAALRSALRPDLIDSMVDFLIGFVVEPVDREQARELLFDLSRDDYNKLLRAVLAENDDFLPSTPTSDDS